MMQKQHLSHVIFLFVALLMLVLSQTVSAEPYIAVKSGLKCSACHSNMTGGGKRTAFGNAYAKSLAAKVVDSNYSEQLNDLISIGGNFRTNWSYTYFRGTTAVGNNPPDEFDNISAFNISNGNIYMEFNVSDQLSFYLDQKVAPEGGRTRESILIIKDIFLEDSYLKVGKMFLPYGLRLQDDQAFIREATRFNFDNADNGIEFGYEPESLAINVALTNGTQGSGETNNDKQLSLVAAYIQPQYRVGFSYSKNNALLGISDLAYNIFAGMNINKFTLLAEVDTIINKKDDAKTRQLISFLSLNYAYSDSLNYKLAYEYLDEDRATAEDEQIRASFIAEKFINQHLQLRSGVRVYDGRPQTAMHNRNIIFTELHMFF